MKRKILFASFLVFAVALLATLGSLLLWHPPALAASAEGAGLPREASLWGWGYLAAALATGLSSLGAAYAVAAVGSAAIGALTEKPELFGRLLILIGLAEGIAIYGVIISVLILDSLAR
jgi:V/A-type H+/Na+-transporting ATPase subunit K